MSERQGEPFVKVLCSILDSSVWEYDSDTRVVWVTLLAMSNASGFVGASIGGIARRAMVPRAKVEAALKKFQEPDPDSRSPDFEGRRIERVATGWRILNHQKIRNATMTPADKERERKRKWWAENRSKAAREKRLALDASGGSARRDLDASSGSDLIGRSESEESSQPDRFSDDPSADGNDAWGLSQQSEKPKQRKSKQRQQRAGQRTTLPPDFAPTEKHRALADKLALDLDWELLAFCAHHEKHGSTFVSWAGALTTWLLNAKRFRDRDGQGEQQPQELTRAERERRNRELLVPSKERKP